MPKTCKMKIRAILIDDEKHAIETLRWQLNEYCPNIEIVKECYSGEDGLSSINELKPQLVFLDIEMPKMSGFAMLEQIDGFNFKVIFTPAYDKYAIKAFKTSAVDYLLKPIDKEELIIAVRKVTESLKQGTLDNQLERLFKELNNNRRIALPTMEGLRFIDHRDISHCNADGSYTLIHLGNKEQIMVSKSIKRLEEMLPNPPFIRVHHSHVVNFEQIDRYIRGQGGYVVMKNGSHVDVSRNRKEEVLKSIQRI